LALGMRALSWSAAMAADQVDADGNAESMGLTGWLSIAVSMLLGVGIFFLGPVLATSWLDGRIPSLGVVLIEGFIRLGLLVGYIWAIGRSSEIQRVFQYHGAEHMTIHAYE